MGRWLKIKLFLCELYGIPIKAKCGHWSWSEATLVAPNEEIVTIKRDDLSAGRPEFCQKCLVKMSVACMCCGNFILPGDFVYFSHLGSCGLRMIYCLEPECWPETVPNGRGMWVAPGEIKVLADYDEIICKEILKLR